MTSALLLSFGVIFVTSLISNMVTLAIFVPLGITLAQNLQVADPVAVGVILGIGPSLDYMLPSGTTTNAIVAPPSLFSTTTVCPSSVETTGASVRIVRSVGPPAA